MRDFINIVEGESALLAKKITLKDGSVGALKASATDHGISVEVAVDDDFCGGVSFGENSWAGKPGTWSATSAFINKEWRRKGVATACYDAMEELGHTVIPEPRYRKRSPDAEAFWANRNRLSEAPIGDWTIDPSFDDNEREMISKFSGYEQEAKHWSDADKIALRDPAIVKKVQSAFLKTPVQFNLYFWQSTSPDYDLTLEKGLTDPEWVKAKLGQNAYDYVMRSTSTDAITVIMTNNLSDEHKISFASPWMVAHRLAHSLMGAGDKTDEGWRVGRIFEQFVYDVLREGYDLEWPDPDGRWGDVFYREHMDIYMKMMGHYLGTMRSARKGRLVQPGEWKHETFAQYLIKGKVTLNPLPDNFDEGMDLTQDPAKRKEALRLWANFPSRLERVFHRTLESAKGKIWVM